MQVLRGATAIPVGIVALLTLLFVDATSIRAQDAPSKPQSGETQSGTGVRKSTDAHFDAGTLVFMSTDNYPAMRKSCGDSAYGQFLADPRVKQYVDRMMKGVGTEMDRAMADLDALSPEDGAEGPSPRAVIESLLDMMSTIHEDATGRVAMALGVRQAAGFQPNLILHIEGGDRTKAAFEKMRGLMTTNAAMMDMKPVEAFNASGFAFQGLEPEYKNMGGMPIPEPDGLFFGQRDNEFVFGISRGGLSDYLQGSNPTSLGGTKLFQSARAAAPSRPSSFNFFFNLEPIWQFLPLAMMGLPPEFQGAVAGVQTAGLTELQGIYSSMTATDSGIDALTFMGLKSKTGVFALIEPGDVSIPEFVPSNALAAYTVRVNYKKVAPLLEEIYRVVEPGAADSDLAEMRGMFQQQMGVTVDQLFGALEGSTAMISFPVNTAAVMTDPTAATSLNFAMKISDASVFQTLATRLGEMVPPRQVGGRDVFTFPGGVPVSFSFSDEWVVASMSDGDLEKILSTMSNPEAPRLVNDPALAIYAKAAKGSLMYGNTAEAYANQLDVAKLALSAVMFVPGLGERIVSNEDLLYAVTATNLPPADAIRAHFGPSFGTIRVTENGIVQQMTMTNPVKRVKPKPVEEAPAEKQ